MLAGGPHDLLKSQNGSWGGAKDHDRSVKGFIHGKECLKVRR